MKSEFRLDESRREFFVRGKRIHLAPKEIDIIRLLSSQSRAWTRDQLLEGVWGHDKCLGIETRTVDQHIARLRGKIPFPLIETVASFGYRLNSKYATSIKNPPPPDAKTRKRMADSFSKLKRSMEKFERLLGAWGKSL